MTTKSSTTIRLWDAVKSHLDEAPRRHVEIHSLGLVLIVRMVDGARHEDEVVRADEDPSQAAIRAFARLADDRKDG